MLDRKDIRPLFPLPPTELAEEPRTYVTISKLNQSNLSIILAALKQQRRTGRLVIDYNKGGISNITFESIEHIKPTDNSIDNS